MYEISLVSDEETSGYGFMYPAHKPLPADPLARQMIDSLSMETGLSPHRRNEARRIERINMVSQIERLVPEDDSGTTCRAYIVQVVRGKATEFECSIKFTGDGVMKDSAHEELNQEVARVGQLPLGPAQVCNQHAGKAARVVPQVGAEEIRARAGRRATLYASAHAAGIWARRTTK